jgi:hypothetical protein
MNYYCDVRIPQLAALHDPSSWSHMTHASSAITALDLTLKGAQRE